MGEPPTPSARPGDAKLDDGPLADNARRPSGMSAGAANPGATSMKRFTQRVAMAFVAGLLCLAAGDATAQDSLSLDATLKFIRDEVADQGELDFASTTSDQRTGRTWDNQFTAEASAITADSGECALAFHWRSTIDGRQKQAMDSTVPFKRVTAVLISSLDQDIARLNVLNNHPGWVTQVRPSIWVLLVFRTDNQTNTLDFRDRDIAELVAKAMRHAADLCGGASGKRS